MIRLPGQVDAVILVVTTIVDKYGDQTTTTVEHPVVGRFAPERSVEYMAGQASSPGNVTPAQLFVSDATFTPNANDQVRVMGKEWTVEGDPQVWPSGKYVLNLKRFGT
ncbi:MULTISPECIES: hypothetical protein [unclassified Luteococcus]|uniref:hypothetical protein n=1 Tax=unclassified Luteococcus TaxID=2639923 RepID=UPI00313EDC39